MRTGWLKSPCNSPALYPCRLRERTRTPMSRLRLQKMIALSGGSCSRSVRRLARFSRGPQCSTRCSTVDAVELGGATVISLGLFKNFSASLRISSGIVALNIKVWRLFGSLLTMVSMSGMKPMSSMRSASSMTKIFTSFKMIAPRSNKSSMRPGVAIRTSTPLLRASSWSRILSPPMSSAIFRLWLRVYFSKFSAICAANSRVGDNMSERGILARPWPSAKTSIIGSVKLAVLPVPVWAQPITSRIIKTAGIALAWIGVG